MEFELFSQHAFSMEPNRFPHANDFDGILGTFDDLIADLCSQFAREVEIRFLTAVFAVLIVYLWEIVHSSLGQKPQGVDNSSNRPSSVRTAGEAEEEDLIARIGVVVVSKKAICGTDVG